MVLPILYMSMHAIQDCAVDVHEVSKVDKDAFTNLQASGVSILGKNIQVIYGMKQ